MATRPHDEEPNMRNLMYFLLGFALMLLLAPAFANEREGYTQYQRQYQDQHQRNYQRTDAKAYSGSSNTYTNTYREAAQTAYAPGCVVGKCLAAFGVGIQGRGFGLSFGGNKARKTCEARALAIMLMETGNERDYQDGRVILRTHFAEWKRGRTGRYVCKQPTDEHCNKVEPVTIMQPDN